MSAPFELNTDRSGINDLVWNDWLIDRAVDLTIDLLRADWFGRYGADAFRAIYGDGSAVPDRFATAISQRLKTEPCWPTETGTNTFAVAAGIVLPTEEELGGFLGGEHYLHRTLAGHDETRALAVACGAKRFTLSSLVRLRCAGAQVGALQTKVGKDADLHFADYRGVLLDVDNQVRQAAALSAHRRHLTLQHKADLGNTFSTLSASGELRPATGLMIVDPDLWADCPEPQPRSSAPDWSGVAGRS